MRMLFSNAVQHVGRNVTVRRGVKWSLQFAAEIEGYGELPITSKVLRFIDLGPEDIADEHDPACRTYEGLLEVMRRVYPGFDGLELVTVVAYNIDKERA